MGSLAAFLNNEAGFGLDDFDRCASSHVMALGISTDEAAMLHRGIAFDRFQHFVTAVLAEFEAASPC